MFLSNRSACSKEKKNKLTHWFLNKKLIRPFSKCHFKPTTFWLGCHHSAVQDSHEHSLVYVFWIWALHLHRDKREILEILEKGRQEPHTIQFPQASPWPRLIFSEFWSSVIFCALPEHSGQSVKTPALVRLELKSVWHLTNNSVSRAWVTRKCHFRWLQVKLSLPFMQ